jgi:hypothetical protein
MNRVGWILCLFLTISGTANGGELVGNSRRHTDAFTVRSSSDHGMELTYAPRPRSFSLVRIDSADYVLYSGAASAIREGTPHIPTDVVTIGVPPDATPVAELTGARYLTESSFLIAPEPTYELRGSGEVSPRYRKDPVVYARNTFWPSQSLVVGDVTMLRGQRICAIRVSPVQYNPATRELRRLVSATLTITFRGLPKAAVPGPSTAIGDRWFEPLFKDLLANYEQAKGWRQAQSRPLWSTQDSSRSWFRTGQTYVRVPVAVDGWYRLTTNDLMSAGVLAQQVNWGSIAFYARGASVPFEVYPDSSIGLFARRNYGDSTYYDFYTDTNVVWMTWNDPSGRRFAQVTEPSGTPTSTIRSLPEVRHNEQNTGFYIGTGNVELGQNTPVPGRGWVWEYYYPGTTIAHPFQLDTIDALTYSTATVRVRLFSTTPNYAFDGHNHKATFWLNDSLIGSAYFAGRTGVTYEASVPSTLLMDGTNTFTLKSDTTSSLPNQFYLDWFEVAYGRHLRATRDQLTFTAPPSSGNLVSFNVDGFSAASITVYDLTLGRRIDGGTVTGDSSNGFSIAFRDTLSVARTYAVVSSFEALPVVPLAKKTFADIRANTQGADYIVISHANFLAQARQLASQRQSINRVRTAVVDVQDIYDEFNFGVLNGEKIKDFLRYAYDNWPGSKPAYLLLFGGASWDLHHYLPTSVKTNYVPAYGVPSGDNWYVCFNPDTTFLPSMLVGRLPVQDAAQAQAIVSKVSDYDNYPVSDWNKNFLFITGGDDAGEQSSFNGLSDASIRTYVDPPPLGGTTFRVYKNTPAVIDAGQKSYLQQLVKDGLVLLNFLGHSGGRIWGVDIGSPNDLQNTDGKLPFVSSVSCNVGAFAEPSSNVLAEDFVLAPTRGAIAAWGSAALGYPFQGEELLNNFLQGVQQDSLRDFGTLTTLARIRMWENDQSFISQSDMSLTPLLGDPMSRFAVPLKPDLAVQPADISLNRPSPTPLDTALVLRAYVHNYGIVPTDSVIVSITELYKGQTSTIAPYQKIRPPLHLDSLVIPWNAARQVGKHTITVNLDPGGSIPEVNKANNLASADIYIYASDLIAIRPLPNQVLPPGLQQLVVTSPLGGDSTSFQFVFELDTVSTFDSPFKMTSPSVNPGPVSGQWITPPLASGQLFFWRARTVDPLTVGRWVASSFTTLTSPPGQPVVRLREYASKQFARDQLVQASPTDSGVVISPRSPLFLYARSLGYRAIPDKDYFSIIRLNSILISGFWWHLGNSFMVLRVNEFTGEYAFSSFDVADQASQADSMRSFIFSTPPGNYLAFSVIFDGSTNVTDSLKSAIESLGSTMIRSVLPGQSWSFIGRKGYPSASVESLTNDSAVVSIQIPNFFSFGTGTITTLSVPIPSRWHSLHWQSMQVPGKTDATLRVLGVRQSGRVDTLTVIPRDSVNADLSGLGLRTIDSSFAAFQIAVRMTTTDALVTPALHEVSVDIEPPADLAISQKTIGWRDFTVTKGTAFALPVTIYNLGFRKVDSARVNVEYYDARNTLHPFTSGEVDSIQSGGSTTAMIPIQTSYLSGRVTFHVTVSPVTRVRDLVAENNSANYTFSVIGARGSSMRFFADGVQLMDGDFVSTKPAITIGLPAQQGTPPGQRQVDFYADNVLVGSSSGRMSNRPGVSFAGTGDPVFNPVLSDGTHDLRGVVSQANLLGGVDSVEQHIAVNVLSEAKVLQVLNYPNPFVSETSFTFILTGTHAPEELTIRVFTVAGRKIREIPVPPASLQIGFNRIHWDGRDNDGDEIANGYYLYQVQMRSNGKTDVVIGKLVKMR